MRVIGGSARGRRLEAPKGSHARPTLDRVRESLFNILAPRLAGARFLDLYAGSGANGIEALSRGAAWATFMDAEEASIRAVRKNLELTGLAASAQVVRAVLPGGLARLEHEAPYDIVFADPPFRDADIEGLLRNLRNANVLAHEGVMVWEHSSRVEVPDESAGYRRARQTRYGEVALTFFVDESAKI